MAGVSIKVRGIEFEPPGLVNEADAVKLVFWQAVAQIAVEEKIVDIRAGLDRDGERLRPIGAKTRRYRRSAMTPTGRGDPNAPPLIPGHDLSRTISLLDGRGFTTHAELWWRFDPHTGGSWGDVLLEQRRRGRDVIGLSPACRRRIRVRAWRWYADYRRGQARPGRLPPARPGGVPRVGSYRTRYATYGIGAERLPAGAPWTGGMTRPEWLAYFRQPAAAAAPGRPGMLSRLLAHIWGR